MGGFVQIIEFQTSRVDEVRALVAQYREQRQAEGAQGGPTRGVFTADRDRPGTFVNLIEFPSYEAAMENSNNPATSAMAAKMAELCDGPPRFYNLDVREVFENQPA